MSPTPAFSLKRLLPDPNHPFVQALSPTPGFAFHARNIRFGDVLEDLKVTDAATREQADRTIHDVTLTSSHFGLEFTMTYVLFRDSEVLEISGEARNIGANTIAAVRGPFSLSMEFTLPLGTGVSMTSMHGGGDVCPAYPPPAYRITHCDGVRHLLGGICGGRSTETEAPYAIIADQNESCGFFYCLEWPCRWIFNNVESERPDGSRQLSCLAHVTGTEIDLPPGGVMTLPKAILGFFTGDTIAGGNQLRRHIVRHLRRAPAGATTLPPVFYNHWFGLGNAFDADLLKREAEVYAELGCEYFVVDTGWHRGGFRQGIGNWEHVDRAKFPDGMAAFADHVRSLGMKFGTWLELEFAMADSDWAQQHPNWFYTAPGRQDLLYNKRAYEERLLRLDDPDVRAQVLAFLHDFVVTYGVEWLRWDMNNSPAPFWDANDPPDQWGRIQLAYGHGLYALLDDFMAACPQVHIEACAGGGHRLDLGIVRRAHSAWISDNAAGYHAVRRYQANLNRFLPGSYPNSVFIHNADQDSALHTVFTDDGGDCPIVALRSRMAGSLGFSEPSNLYTAATKARLKQEIVRYKSIRHLLLADYHPLFDPRTLREPDGWQFHDQATGEGFFMLFRCQSPRAEIVTHLHALDPNRTYRAMDMDTGKTRDFCGGAPLAVTIAAENGIAWWRYHLS